jgi:hypothetical protein
MKSIAKFLSVILFFILSVFICCGFEFNAPSWEAKRLREVLSGKMNLNTNEGKRFLNNIDSSSIKLVEIGLCRDTLLFSRIDGVREYIDQEEIPSFLVVLAGHKSRILVSTDVQAELDFQFLGNYQAGSKKTSVDIFYHLSNSVGWERYYIYDPINCSFYTTQQFEFGEKILPESIDLEKKTFHYTSAADSLLFLGNLAVME